MSKQLLPNELAEIVVGLLVKPSILGELDSPEKHIAFIKDIAEVVADHCGGFINDVHAPWDSDGEDVEYLSSQYDSPLVSVSPDDSLPPLSQCVWAYHDPEGWIDESDSEAIEGQTMDDIHTKRMQLQRLLIIAGAKQE